MQNAVVLPSPARLGLSTSTPLPLNPNQNPSPSPQISIPVPNQPSTSTSSSIPAPPLLHHQTPSTLLSLLPPHPRAQFLLLHLSALTTKLFDVSGNRSSWLASYRGTLPTFLPASTLPQEASSASTTKEILSLISSTQSQLSEAITELQEALDLEEAKRKLARETHLKDSAMLAFAKKVKQSEQLLGHLVEDYEDYRKPKKRFKPNSQAEDSGDSYLKLSEILSYAHRISYSTFAPPEFGSGQAPLRGALPPAPQEEQMRASQLYQFADLDVGLPQREETIKPTSVTPSGINFVEPMVDVKAIQGLIVPPPMPSGWKPGMPIEIGDIPSVPPGWKPGDPVPLPHVVEVPAGWKPGDAVVLPKPAEETVPMVQKQIVSNAPEPIQVKFVQLDINPDQDDYSSEYSSDVGSSEEDDEE
ncbi:mediator of RNA polymerase II transcription subunit 4 [Amborella trichopoda]|uniref:Mediator of RNA polymerase II transcription subunit 4 n=1 Tax=Amborella trichopoda TaxID=13333 RepID=W1NUM6_AMBTC|nr:mediator of RNA polymerase II transcription subunit 4 [Amborella trichopoda]XP_011620672.1 mediator of RNA polymerase II transcription subunit 4 [Amborella trichopoda]XP_011620673.1 mediator of RNA polymerase II transcription subunit 4 [Amborella trichopoda]XP_020518428.1 mediator of RNA polymerase II transcription subunit 4 [Amborella trichopoda]ERM98970.1 hypothetical protein AMTR_s00226p00023090 [Amborella trichopoda]|eukprot:XP_006836117.1 mediator of RNA polymerase II transcription subunit 4 [Amborella trichopoda]